jgi:hypothetical protein
MPRAKPLLFALLALMWAPAARAQAVHALASDRTGVTLEITLPGWLLGPADGDGRHLLLAEGLQHTAEAGRPFLPASSVTLGLPPGTRAVARVLAREEGETRENVRLALAGEPTTERGPDGKEIPAMRAVPPVLDGAYPASPVLVGEEMQMRGQRMVGVRITPFVYDEAARRLTALSRVRVRVDFVPDESAAPERPGLEAPAGEDRHFEGVFQTSLLNYSQARSWRAAPRRPQRRLDLQRTLDETRTEVRVRIDTTGVYRVDYAQLAAAGFPAGIPVDEVEAHRHEFVPAQADPPYTNVPVAIEVIEGGTPNGSFDAGDHVLFYAQSFTERARPTHYTQYWGREDYVFVSSAPSAGARVGLRAANRGFGTTTPPAWFPSYARYERNGYQMSYPRDTTEDMWLWTRQLSVADPNPSPPDSFRFSCADLDTSAAATVAASFMGWLDTDRHVVWVDVVKDNGDSIGVADSVVWLARIERVVRNTVFGSSLQEGSGNRLRYRGWSTPQKPYMVGGLNWFEVTYGRRYRALNDYLVCNSSQVEDTALFRVGNFTSPDSIRVYDVTDSTAPVRLVLDPGQVKPDGPRWSVEWEDSVVSGTRRRYVAFREARRVPDALVTAVNRRRLTGPAPDGRVDYLVVTHELFEGDLAPLVALRRGAGLGVLVAPAQAVYDEFNGGRRSPYAIRRFAQFAYQNWQTRFLVLVGDASQDPQAFTSLASPDWIPAPLTFGQVGVSQGDEVVSSDHWYVWCLDGCRSISGAQLPDMFVGRLPVGSSQQARDLVAKIVNYEQFSAQDDWRNRVVFVPDDPYSEQSFFGGGGFETGYCRRGGEIVFRNLAETCRNVILNEGRLRSTAATRFYLYDYLVGHRTPISISPDTCYDLLTVGNYTSANIAPQLAGVLSNGVLFWDYQGHANETQIAHERLWLSQGSIQDLDQVNNPGRPFLLTAYACHVNNFSRASENDFYGDGMGERMVTAPGNRGAIAVYASSGFEALPFLPGTNHLDVWLVRSLFSEPPFDPYLGDRGARVVLGEAVATAYTRFYSTIPPFSERGTSQTYHLLGDPGLRLNVAGPQNFVTANGDTLQDGATVRLHSPGDTLRFIAEITSNNAITGIELQHVLGGSATVIPPASYTLVPSLPDTLVNGGRYFTLSYKDTLVAADFSYVLRATDRFGVVTQFTAPFVFTTVMRVDGSAITDGDVVAPDADVSLLVLVPTPVDPDQDLQLLVNGLPQTFSYLANPGDASGREWILSWVHGPFPKGDNNVALTIGSETRTRTFRVSGGADALAIEQVAAFPNPFEDDLGCHFSFVLNTGAYCDLMLRVFTVNGRLIYERLERGLGPGYHQLRWDGLDAEGSKLANGTYLYRLIARNPQTESVYTGRLVKYRKPKTAPEPTTP